MKITRTEQELCWVPGQEVKSFLHRFNENVNVSSFYTDDRKKSKFVSGPLLGSNTTTHGPNLQTDLVGMSL
jgi:hypothetical protein